MHRGLAAVRVAQEGADFSLPVRHQVRRHHQQQRISLQFRHGGQRLDGLSQAHLVGQQRARRVDQVRRALALEGHELALEEGRRRVQHLGRAARPLPRGGIVARILQCLLPARGIRGPHGQGVAQHEPVQVARVAPVGREPRHTAALSVAAGEEALGHLADDGLALDDPGAGPLVVTQLPICLSGRGGRSAQVRGQQVHLRQFVKGIVFAHPMATPQSRFSATTAQGLPPTCRGRSTVRSVTTTSEATSGRAA